MRVEVWFFEGVRQTPPQGAKYRPHFVVKGAKEYLGIQFENLPPKPFGTHIICEVKPIYNTVDYTVLTKNTCFEINEGANVVGEGFVVE